MNVGYVELYHVNKQPTPSNPRNKFEGKENSPISKLFNNIHLDISSLYKSRICLSLSHK